MHGAHMRHHTSFHPCRAKTTQLRIERNKLWTAIRPPTNGKPFSNLRRRLAAARPRCIATNATICDIDTGCVAFCWTENISAPNLSYAAQYLACALPCERFTSALADIRASLGAGAVRYSFTVTDFHRLPLAGLPAHPSTSSRGERLFGVSTLSGACVLCVLVRHLMG
jgi:hypothetical protein